MPHPRDEYPYEKVRTELATIPPEAMMALALSNPKAVAPKSDVRCRASAAAQVAVIVENMLLMTPHGKVTIEPNEGSYLITLVVP